MPNSISIRIDGEFIKASDGQSILEAATAAGKFIPALCHLKGLAPVGACRICIVEVAGVNRLLPACTTPAQDGMSVTTNSEKLRRYRRVALELLFSEGNHTCSVCVSNSHCELQDLAQRLGVTNIRYPYSFPKAVADLSHRLYVLDRNRCILCTRCVRTCATVEGAAVWDVAARGISSHLIAELDQPWGTSRNCTDCGKCVQSCPTGALAQKGYAVEEMKKRNEPITRLAAHRGASL